ncbi:MAG: Hpt domain-containing protein, partial [Lachnospiraceae bacterium]|nr:Hpt domain-containing protein [Lachnospiraceae bacterium]
EKMLVTYLPENKVKTGDGDTKNSIDGNHTAGGKAGSDKEADEDKKDNESLFKELENIGVDIKEGLAYSGHDEESYRSILAVFSDEEKEKAPKLAQALIDGDLESYGIYIHSLKSTSKALGAKELSELAAGSEAAAKSKDMETVRKNHEKVMELYLQLVTLIREYIAPDEGRMSAEDDIIEFMPDVDE